jgi:ATP-dependent RNA helicase DeaD
LGFFREVVNQIEHEQDIGAQDIAAALTYLMQRDRPLQAPEVAGVKAMEPRTAESRTTEKPRNRTDAESPPARQRERRPRESADLEMMRYRIEVGHAHGATPQNIVGAIANEAGIESRYIGRIEIHDDHSTVDLPTGMSDEIFQHLRKVRVRQCPLNISRLGPSEPEKPRKRLTLGSAAARETTASQKAPRSDRSSSAGREFRPPSRRKREFES